MLANKLGLKDSKVFQALVTDIFVNHSTTVGFMDNKVTSCLLLDRFATLLKLLDGAEVDEQYL